MYEPLYDMRHANKGQMAYHDDHRELKFITFDLPWYKLFCDAPFHPIFIFCKWKLCSFPVLCFSPFIVLISYCYFSNKYSIRMSVFWCCAFPQISFEGFPWKALLEVALDGQLSLIWDLYHIKEWPLKNLTWVRQKTPSPVSLVGSGFRKRLVQPARATPPWNQNFCHAKYCEGVQKYNPPNTPVEQNYLWETAGESSQSQG